MYIAMSRLNISSKSKLKFTWLDWALVPGMNWMMSDWQTCAASEGLNAKAIVEISAVERINMGS